MKNLGKILFFIFALVVISKLIVPEGFLIEVEELVEVSDDSESEEDREDESDEFEWKWHFETPILDISSINIFYFNYTPIRKLGEISEGERVIFSPPPENVI